jgi:protein RecA
MSKEEKKPKLAWVKPTKSSDIEKLMMRNLEGFARKGARVVSHGFWPTGHFNLDFAISYGRLPVNVDLSSLENFNPREPGGIPKGKITEVYGEEGGGKTSLCLRTAANAQKMGGTVMWVDKENSFSEKLAKLNGIDLDAMYMMDKAGIDAEKTFDLMIDAMRSGIGLIVVDSVASLIPRYRYENDLDKDTVALLARAMSKYMPTIGEVAAESGCAVAFINQIRDMPGVMFGDTTTTPGGKALKFFSSLRLQVSKRYGKDAEVWKENEDGDQILVAREAHVYVRKNRFAKNLNNGIPCPIYFEPYSPNTATIAFDIGRQLQVVKVREGVFSWKTEDDKKVSAEGRKAFIDEIEGQKMLDGLIADIKKEAQSVGMVLPPELMTFKLLDGKQAKKKNIEHTEKTAAIQAFFDAEAQEPEEPPMAVKEKSTPKGWTRPQKSSDETDTPSSRKKATGKSGGTDPLE